VVGSSTVRTEQVAADRTIPTNHSAPISEPSRPGRVVPDRLNQQHRMVGHSISRNRGGTAWKLMTRIWPMRWSGPTRSRTPHPDRRGGGQAGTGGADRPAGGRARPGWRSTTPCSLSRAAEPRLPAVVAALVRVVAVRAAVVLVVGAALPVGSLRSVPRRAAQPLAVATGVARGLRGGRPSSALRGRRRLLRLGPALSRTARPARPIRHATLRAPGRGGTAPPLPGRRRHEAFAHAQTVSRFSPSRS
jgi:hypothetical protein